MERNNTKNEKFPFTHLLEDFSPENLNRVWAVVAIDQLFKAGVRHFYLSPGMRNAPFIYALAKAKNIEVYDIMDERSAAFRALGYSKASGSPSALICTSGTAMANYLPAIIEASVNNVPLVVISADRPIQLVNHGANQSIPQTDLFGPNVKHKLNFPEPNSEDSLQWLASAISHKLFQCFSTDRTPVHLISPLENP